MTAARLVRWGVPILLTVGGVIVAMTWNEGVGEAIVGSAACVLLAAWLMRLSISDNVEREREEAARDFFDAHGHWPDEE
ncbi:MAG TPA: hypothetical protein VIL64_04965 [Solirubrobacteraceae bacterium]|jgi:uncharacterized protein (DUF697 family)